MRSTQAAIGFGGDELDDLLVGREEGWSATILTRYY